MSSQTVYFTNPAIISGLVNGSTSMSGSISTLQQQITTVCVTGSFTAQANFRYQYTLPFKWSGSVVTVTCTLPASPADGATVTLVDGNYFYGWGNTFYQCRVNGNGKEINGAIAALSTSNGELFNWRGQTIQLVFSQALNSWMSTSQGNAISKAEDPYTGWWELMTKVYMPTLATRTKSAYIYIDATQYPIVQTYFEGTNKATLMKTVMGSFTLYEAQGPTGSNPYSRFLSGIANSVVNPTGPLTTFSNSATWNLYFPGASYDYIALSNRSQYDIQSVSPTTQFIYRRINNPTNTSVNQPSPFQTIDNQGGEFIEQSLYDPAYLFKKLMNEAEISQATMNSNMTNYGLDYYQRKQALDDVLSTQGITFEVPISMVRRSHVFTGANIGTLTSYTGGSTQLTDICCAFTQYCTPGSTVTLSGFTGDWSDLNGTYVNGVSALNWQSNKENAKRIDYLYTGPADKTTRIITGSATGTSVVWVNRFLLIKDTANHTGCYETGPYAGFNNVPLGNPKVTVTHKVYPGMPPNEWFAAYMALVKYMYTTFTHATPNLYFNTPQGRLITNWSQLSGVANTDYGTIRIRPKGGEFSPSTPILKALYQTGINNSGFRTQLYSLLNLGQGLNDPYQSTYFINKNISFGNGFTDLPGINFFNYCETGTLKNLYTAFDGSAPTGPFQTYYASTIGTKNLSNTSITGGSTIVGQMFPYRSPYTTGAYSTMYTNPTAPTGTIWRLAGTNTNNFVVGKIRSELCGGKTVMYIYASDFSSWYAEDMGSRLSVFAPSNFTGPAVISQYPNWKAFGAQYQIFSAVSKYINSFTGSTGGMGPDTVIFDIRNNGGGNDRQAVLSMFGGERFYVVDDTLYHDDGYSQKGLKQAISTGSNAYWSAQTGGKTFSSPDDFQFKQYKAFWEKLYPDQIMAASFGNDAVIRNCNLIILTNETSASLGEKWPTLFFGDNGDRNIGNGVKVNIIGERTPGNYGFISNTQGITPPTNSKRFNNSSFCSYCYDFAIFDRFTVPTGPLTGYATAEEIPTWNYNNASTGPNALVGQAVNTALPNDFTIPLYDLGLEQNLPPNYYIPQSRANPIFSDATTWRDAWLEQAIRQGQYM